MSIVKYDIHRSVGATTKEEVIKVEQYFIALEKLEGLTEISREEIEFTNAVDPVARGKEVATHKLLESLKRFCEITDEIDTVSGNVIVRAVFHAPYIRDSVMDQLEYRLSKERSRSGELYNQWVKAQASYENIELELNIIKNQSVIKFAWRRLVKYWRKYIWTNDNEY